GGSPVERTRDSPKRVGVGGELARPAGAGWTPRATGGRGQRLPRPGQRRVNTGESIRIHPDNRKLFLFRGRPRVLLCATEHYGSVLNRTFDFARYLDEAAARNQTLTRHLL